AATVPARGRAETRAGHHEPAADERLRAAGRGPLPHPALPPAPAGVLRPGRGVAPDRTAGTPGVARPPRGRPRRDRALGRGLGERHRRGRVAPGAAPAERTAAP